MICSECDQPIRSYDFFIHHGKKICKKCFENPKSVQKPPTLQAKYDTAIEE